MSLVVVITDSQLQALSSPPSFNVDVDLHFSNSLPLEFLSMWNERAVQGRLPARRDFDVLELKDYMGWLCTAEVTSDRTDLLYRLIGTKVVDNVGRDMTGALVSETLPEAAVQIFLHLMTDPRPVRTWGSVGWQDRDFKHHESLVLPLADDGQTVDRFFVMMMFF